MKSQNAVERLCFIDPRCLRHTPARLTCGRSEYDLLLRIELSYAITIHKSMGSEYDTVIIPLLAAHNVLLTRNLLYTAITRAKRRVLLVGEKRALYMAIHRSRKGKRNTMLGERIALYYKAVTRKALRNEEGEEWQRAS